MTKKDIIIRKQIQTEKFIIHTDEVEPLMIEKQWRIYPKLETKGYVKLPFELKNITEKEYAKCILEHFKFAILSGTETLTKGDVIRVIKEQPWLYHEGDSYLNINDLIDELNLNAFDEKISERTDIDNNSKVYKDQKQ